MAKAPVATAPKAATIAGFKIDTGVALPAIVRKVGAASSPYTDVMKGMEYNADPAKMQSFFIPAEVPSAITDEAERAKAAKDEARKISNRVSGISRRLVKADASLAFALRTVTENGQVGVRVYRVAPEAPAAA